MNIAICISGEPRYYQRSVNSIQNIKLKYPNCKIDVFCHLWNNITHKNKKNSVITKQNIVTEISTEENILKELQTTDGKIDNKEILNYYSDLLWDYIENKVKDGFRKVKKFKTTWVSKDILRENIKNSNSPPLSQLVSMCKSNIIRINYEKKHNIVYDYVIRTRTDVEFTGPKIERLISEKRRQRNIIFFPSIHYIGSTLYVEYCFFIGSSRTLDLNIFGNYENNLMDAIINVNLNNKTVKTRSSHAAVPYFIRLSSDVQLQSGILDFNQHLLQRKSI